LQIAILAARASHRADNTHLPGEGW
jgi:hypothetical protein